MFRSGKMRDEEIGDYKICAQLDFMRNHSPDRNGILFWHCGTSLERMLIADRNDKKDIVESGIKLLKILLLDELEVFDA
jgi:hypothetical protein